MADIDCAEIYCGQGALTMALKETDVHAFHPIAFACRSWGASRCRLILPWGRPST